MSSLGTIEQILDLARWAPSGDNTQPWRFEIVNDDHFVVHGHDTRTHCVYDLDGHPSQISLGALLENIVIAASGHGLRTQIQRRKESPEEKPLFDVKLEFAGAPADPLIPYIQKRSVQRRAMRTRKLTADEKRALELSVGDAYAVSWWEGLGPKWRVAKLMFDNAHLRLTLPEAYLVHRNVIEWNARFSENKVPDQALGLDKGTLKLMHWVMQTWGRVDFFNKYLAGHLVPRVEMDLLPGVFCGAHFALVAQKEPDSIDEYVAAGRAVQRFWLTSTSLGLGLQPELTPLIFSRYVREGRSFSLSAQAKTHANELAERLEDILKELTPRTIFLGRIGMGRPVEARSLRSPLRDLRWQGH